MNISDLPLHVTYLVVRDSWRTTALRLNQDTVELAFDALPGGRRSLHLRLAIDCSTCTLLTIDTRLWQLEFDGEILDEHRLGRSLLNQEFELLDLDANRRFIAIGSLT